MAKAGRGSEQVMVRLPDGMRDQIKRYAEENGRSMNAEIVDVLREHFPVDQSLEEILDSLQHTIGLLKTIQTALTTGDKAQGRDIDTALGALFLLNEDLSKIIENEQQPRVAMLRPDAADAITRLRSEYQLDGFDLDGTVSNLVLMGVEQILDRGENYRAWIGDGDARRMLEIRHPNDRPKQSK